MNLYIYTYIKERERERENINAGASLRDEKDASALPAYFSAQEKKVLQQR